MINLDELSVDDKIALMRKLESWYCGFSDEKLKRKQQRRKYYLKHQQQIKDKTRRYYEKNTEKCKNAVKKYIRLNREN